MNLNKKCTVKPFSLLVIDTTLVSNNTLRFGKNFYRKNIITNYDN